MSPLLSWHHKQKVLAKKSGSESAVSLMEPLWTKAFCNIWTLNFIACCWAFSINTTYPFYVKHLGGSEMLVGAAAGGYALFCLLMRPLSGWILDHKSRRVLLQGGAVFMGIVSLGYFFAPSLAILVALRQLNGITYSGVSTSSTTNACDVLPQSRFGEGIGMLGLSNTVATALGPAIGLMIMQMWGFNTLYLLTTALALVAFLLSRATKYKPVKPAVYLPGRHHLRLSELFNPAAIPASVVTLLAMLTYGGVNVFVALYGEYQGLGSGGPFFILMAVGAGSMRLFTGRLADKFGEAPNVYFGNAAYFTGIILLLFNSSVCYYLSGLFWGLGFGISIPALQAMAVRIVPQEQRGSASSTFLCSYDVGAGLGGLISGWLVTVWGYRPMFAALSVFIIFSTLAYILWAGKSPSAFKVYKRGRLDPEGNAIAGGQENG